MKTDEIRTSKSNWRSLLNHQGRRSGQLKGENKRVEKQSGPDITQWSVYLRQTLRARGLFPDLYHKTCKSIPCWLLAGALQTAGPLLCAVVLWRAQTSYPPTPPTKTTSKPLRREPQETRRNRCKRYYYTNRRG